MGLAPSTPRDALRRRITPPSSNPGPNSQHQVAGFQKAGSGGRRSRTAAVGFMTSWLDQLPGPSPKSPGVHFPRKRPEGPGAGNCFGSSRDQTGTTSLSQHCLDRDGVQPPVLSLHFLLSSGTTLPPRRAPKSRLPPFFSPFPQFHPLNVRYTPHKSLLCNDPPSFFRKLQHDPGTETTYDSSSPANPPHPRQPRVRFFVPEHLPARLKPATPDSSPLPPVQFNPPPDRLFSSDFSKFHEPTAASRRYPPPQQIVKGVSDTLRLNNSLSV